MGLAPTPAPGLGAVAGSVASTAVNPTGGAGGVAGSVANTAINIQKIADPKKEAGEDITIAVDPVKDILVFPHQNNRTYRAGYVMLMAFANDYSLKDIAGSVDQTLEYKQKNTKAKKRAQTFNGDASAYLANARANNRRFRKIPGTKLAFTAILPMPLGIGETTQIDWNSSPSGFNQQIVGAAYQAGSSWASYLKNGGTFNDSIQGYIGDTKEFATKAVDALASSVPGGEAVVNGAKTAGRFVGDLVDASVLGSNVIAGTVLGDNSMHQAAMGSVAGGMVTRPSKKMMQLQGPLMDYAREAAAINGRRQIINDPGFWQNFQGVNPRSFTLRWTVIPENHEDAMNGLALCARIKEFSLPESVSEVELLSPHYWQIQFSNPLVQSQLLYNNLVIKTINVTFMENGEVHLSGTPKKFDIEITFEEAKAPNAEVYKVYDESLRLQGGKLRNSPSIATASIPKLGGSSGGLGGSLGSVFPGKFGGLGSNPLGALGGLSNSALGAVAGIAGGAIGGLSSAIGNNLGGAVGGIFGDYTGNLVADTVSNAVNSAGSVLVDSIATGNFDNLGDRMKDAALAGATATVIDAASEVVGEYVSKVTDYAMETLGDTLGGVTDWLESAVGSISPEEEKARGTARTKAKEAKEQQEKVKELKEKLKEVEASKTLTKEQKDQARKKVEEEYNKAQKLAKEAEAAKKDAESYRKKAEEVKKAEEAKKAQEKADKNGAAALGSILGN
jgi:MAEBL|nr:MAG TPA: Baseplate wedge protein [Caudoviricetes sp.]